MIRGFGLLRTLCISPRLHRLRMIILGFAVLLGGSTSMAHLFERIVVNGTPSVSAHILIKAPGEEIHKGDYVLVPTQNHFLPNGFDSLTKHVLCVEGDVLAFKRGAFYCNGEFLHRPKRQSLSGASLDAFFWREGVVPHGKVYVGSPHPDGFDSRYLGLFDLDDLTRLEAL